MNDCEDCNVNGYGCRAHGREIAVPGLLRSINRATEAEGYEAAEWLAFLHESYAEDDEGTDEPV